MPVHWCCHQLLYSGHYNSCFWERRRKISPGPFAGIDNVWIKIDLHRYLMSNARPKALLYPIGKYFGPKGLIGDGSKSSVLERQKTWKDKRKYVHKAAGQPRFLGVQKQRWFSNAGRKTKDLENLLVGIFRLRNDLQCDLLLSGASSFSIPKRSVSFQRK